MTTTKKPNRRAKHRTYTVPEETQDLLIEAGQGNASKGIRVAVEAWKRQNDKEQQQ